MPDALERARHYRKRAAESQALADAAPPAAIKDHYCAMPANYIALAEAEEIMMWPWGTGLQSNTEWWTALYRNTILLKPTNTLPSANGSSHASVS